jgi:hypothetical protein
MEVYAPQANKKTLEIQVVNRVARGMQSGCQAKFGCNIRLEYPSMTTISFNGFNDAGYTYFAKSRAPKKSFAARLAALQARHEQATHTRAVLGVVVPAALALVPFTALAWVFVTL